MLSNAELTYMRDSIELLLPDTCNILSNTPTADGFGGVTDSWGTASASVPCRLDIVKSNGYNESLQGGKIVSFQETVLSLPYDTTIALDYRVSHGGKIYNVTAVNTGQSWVTVKRATLELVNGG